MPQVLPIGSEFQVNTYTSDSQSNPTIAMDTDGDFVISWMSNGQDGSGFGIFAQRYNSAGVAVGSEFQVNTYTTSEQSNPAIAMDADGDFAISWISLGQDGSSRYGIFAQRYNSAGAAVGGEFGGDIYISNSFGNPTIAMDADGDFVISWTNGVRPSVGYVNVYAQRYDHNAVPVGERFQVNANNNSICVTPTIATDADGDFVISWASLGQDGSGYGIFAQRYNSAGVAAGSEFQVNTYTNSEQSNPAIAMDADGDFVISWTSGNQDGSGYGIYAQRYDRNGVAVGSEFQVNSYTNGNQSNSTIDMDADGDFVISWTSNGQDGSGTGIYAQRYDRNGVAVGSEFQVNSYTNGNQYAPTIAMGADGDFTISWTSDGQDGSGPGIYAQRYVFSENTSPITVGISDVSVLLDSPNTEIDLFAAFKDSEDADAQLTYTVVGNTNSALFSSTKVDQSTGILTLDYAPEAFGSGSLTVRATDTAGLFVETAFNVNVNSY